MRVTTVVLGDLGRSPRMQYHAEALAAHEVDVDVVACGGSAVHPETRIHPRITCHLLPPTRERSLPRAIAAAGRHVEGVDPDTEASLDAPGRGAQA